jgi:internalin A
MKNQKLIDLTNKSISIIPNSVFAMKELETLILDDNSIELIPDDICELTKLKELSINNNKITKISKNIAKLTKLETLSIAGNSLDELPIQIFNILNLKNLFCYDNKLSQLNKEIKKLTNLEVLILSNNNIYELPPEIGLLSNLQELDLSFNQLYVLPDSILQLINLESLDLFNNQLSGLPKIVNELPSLVNLSLSNNPIELPPPEIAIERDMTDSNIGKIRNFFKEYASGNTDYLFEIKLLLVGEGRVGKTSIAKKLTTPKYELQDEHSTEGIDIKPWIISKNDFIKNEEIKIKPKKNLRINIWDFGGQEIYHATHQFFLTKRSMYLLVTESRQEDKPDDFFYWLNCIKIFGDNSPAIIVQNKCDQPIKDIPFKEFQKEFSNIISLQRISCKHGFGQTIIDLKEEIKRIVSNTNLLPHLGSPLPQVWIEVRKDIESLQDKKLDYLDFDEYLKICKKHELSEKRAIFLSEFFHDVGVVLHFHKDWELKDTLFINHEWVTNGVYKVLDNLNIILKHGIFNKDDLEQIWKQKRYYNKRRELLALMKKFELCFEIEPDKYLLPQLLPVDEVEYEWDDSKVQLKYYYQYKFMPKGILTRLIVKRNCDIYNSKYWRYGVILEYAETKALIREKYFDRKLTIDITGKNKKLMLQIIQKSIKEIHADFSNIEVEEMVPCNCDECVSTIIPNFYKLSELELRQKKQKDTIECYKSYAHVSINSILSNIQIDRDEESKSKYNNSIFISYSHCDEYWLEKVLKNLKVLKKEGYVIDIWSDKQIKASQNWRDEIYKSLNKAKIGILLISTDFLASDFIIDNELPILLKHAKTRGTNIVPVLLRPSRFLKNKILSQFEAVNNAQIPLSELSESKQDELLVSLTNRIEEILKDQS